MNYMITWVYHKWMEGGGVHKMYMKGRPSLLTFKRVQNLLSQTTSPSEVYIAMFSSGKIAMKMIKTCMVKMLKVFFYH